MTGSDDPPARLARYVPEDWPGGPAEWGEAAKRWLSDHPGRPLPLAAIPAHVDEWVAALRR